MSKMDCSPIKFGDQHIYYVYGHDKAAEGKHGAFPVLAVNTWANGQILTKTIGYDEQFSFSRDKLYDDVWRLCKDHGINLLKSFCGMHTTAVVHFRNHLQRVDNIPDKGFLMPLIQEALRLAAPSPKIMEVHIRKSTGQKRSSRMKRKSSVEKNSMPSSSTTTSSRLLPSTPECNNQENQSPPHSSFFQHSPEMFPLTPLSRKSFPFQQPPPPLLLQTNDDSRVCVLSTPSSPSDSVEFANYSILTSAANSSPLPLQSQVGRPVPNSMKKKLRPRKRTENNFPVKQMPKRTEREPSKQASQPPTATQLPGTSSLVATNSVFDSMNTRKEVIKANGIRTLFRSQVDYAIENLGMENQDFSPEELVKDIELRIKSGFDQHGKLTSDYVKKAQTARTFCATIDDYENLNKKLGTFEKQSYTCNICCLNFSADSSYRIHRMKHIVKRIIYLCPIEGCNFFHYQAGRMNAHLQYHHKMKGKLPEVKTKVLNHLEWDGLSQENIIRFSSEDEDDE